MCWLTNHYFSIVHIENHIHPGPCQSTDRRQEGHIL